MFHWGYRLHRQKAALNDADTPTPNAFYVHIKTEHLAAQAKGWKVSNERFYHKRNFK